MHKTWAAIIKVVDNSTEMNNKDTENAPPAIEHLHPKWWHSREDWRSPQRRISCASKQTQSHLCTTTIAHSPSYSSSCVSTRRSHHVRNYVRASRARCSSRPLWGHALQCIWRKLQRLGQILRELNTVGCFPVNFEWKAQDTTGSSELIWNVRVFKLVT